LVSRHPTTEVVGIEVDERQLAKNLLTPVERLRFEKAGAQAIPFPDASFDGALMLKSLHHVPMPLMDQAVAELARVLRPIPRRKQRHASEFAPLLLPSP
jgi:ubiquinone/menaquinone biosynthesis C-methylase UbiE